MVTPGTCILRNIKTSSHIRKILTWLFGKNEEFFDDDKPKNIDINVVLLGEYDIALGNDAHMYGKVNELNGCQCVQLIATMTMKMSH